MTVYDDGGGSALYAGGVFASAGGMPANHVAKWNGSSWAALGSGISSPSGPTVLALTVYDDGSGPALYAGGVFTSAGGMPANHVAKWNGSSWSALGSGIAGDPAGSPPPRVLALTVFDDGSGPALYAGGYFTSAGGVPANHIAKWNDSSWAALGTGMNHEVLALAEYDDGSGPALYAGGRFNKAEGQPASHIAKWNGSSWSGLQNPLNRLADALTVFDDGSGPALYAGGEFSLAGGVVANQIAKWNGTSWSALGSGVSNNFCYNAVQAIAVFDDGGGPALYAGGDFMQAGGTPASYIARWGCPDSVPPVLSCPPPISVPDRLFDGHEIVYFTVTATDGVDPAPVVVCVPPSGSTFPLGTTLVDCTATDALGNQSSCQFPVTVSLKARRR